MEEETLKKVVPHSVATAFASIVLPVPGGPTISTPFHGRRMPCTAEDGMSGGQNGREIVVVCVVSCHCYLNNDFVVRVCVVLQLSYK